MLLQTHCSFKDNKLGREAFKTLLRDITYYLRSGSEVSLLEYLRAFHLLGDTEFSTFSQRLFPFLDEVRMLEGTTEKL